MRWCHLASDESLEELHAFAEAHGIPRRGFHGDHYDVPDEYRSRLIDGGARVVESRELLRRLREAGLRLTPAGRRQQSAPGGSPAGELAQQVARTGDVGADDVPLEQLDP